MSSRINTNVAALQAASALDANSNALNTNIERLSTGLRINSAADDPAGYAISENFKAQISGLSTATSNSNDAINEVKTAEGALNQVQNLLVSMRQLAVNASNLGTNSTTDLEADQTQINSAIASINQISSTTSFGNVYLLNGSATNASTTTQGATTGTGVTIAAQGEFNVAQAGSYNTISVTQAQNAFDAFSFGANSPLSTASTGSYSGSLIINGSQYSLNTSAPSTLTDLNSAIAASGYQASIDASGELVFTNQATGSISTPGQINIGSLTVGTSEAIDPASGAAGSATNGTVNLAGGGVTLSSTLANNTVGAAGGNIVFALNGGTATTVSATAGETLAAFSTALAADGLTLSVASDNQSLNVVGAGNISVSTFSVPVANATLATIGTAAAAHTLTIAPTGGAFNSTPADNTFSQAGSIQFTDAASAGTTYTVSTAVGETLSAFMTDLKNAGAGGDTNLGAISINGAGSLVIAGDSTDNIAVTTATNLTTKPTAQAGAGEATITTPTAGTNAGYTFNTAGATTLTSAGALFSGVITVSGGAAAQVLTLSPGTSLATLNTDLASASASVTATVDSSGNLVFTSQGSLSAPTVTLGTGFDAYQAATVSGSTDSTTNLGSNAVLTLNNGVNTLVSESTQSSGGSNYFSFANGLVVATTVTSGSITGNVTATGGKTTTGQTLEYQIGANGGETTSIDIQSTAANQLGTNAANYVDANGTTQTVDTDSIADLNLMTFKGSQDAIAVIDAAINQVSTLSANLGAFQNNVLQSNVTSLGTAQQNLSSSLSTIEDTDLSTEVVSYTKNQILVQAATSALSEANQAPQAILKLLQ